jgi:hypothetical protein
VSGTEVPGGPGDLTGGLPQTAYVTVSRLQCGLWKYRSTAGTRILGVPTVADSVAQKARDVHRHTVLIPEPLMDRRDGHPGLQLHGSSHRARWRSSRERRLRGDQRMHLQSPHSLPSR